MKELSIEEKAKRYDEIIEKFDVILNLNTVKESGTIFADDVRKIIPELIENEDEEIRKHIIQVFRDHFNGEDCDKCIAWLEKQDEHDVYKESFNDGYKLGYREASENIQEEPEKYGLCKIEKLGEQNPAFSEEDEYVFNKVLNWVLIVNPTSSIFEKLPKEQFIERFKSIRPQINITDEELAQAKKDAYNDALDKIEYHSGKPTFDDGWSAAIWYLKKRNAQPQNRWKESLATADLENSLCDIQDGFSDTSYEYRILGEAIEFIRCTESKSQWKPSDKQVKALRWVLQNIPYNTHKEEINELLLQLQQL